MRAAFTFLLLAALAVGQTKASNLLCLPENAQLLNDLVHDRSKLVRDAYIPVAKHCAEKKAEHTATSPAPAKLEPFVVPGIKKVIVNRPESEGRCATGQYLVMHKDGLLWCEADQYSCADKRRIGPLYSADGKSHCILLPQEKP